MNPTLTWTRGLALTATLLALVGGCGGKQPTAAETWERDLYYTHRLHMDGQYALAAKRYAALRKTARSPADADEAALVACEAARRAARLPEAAACFDELAKSGQSRPNRARALLHGAELRYDDLNKPADGVKMFQALVQRAPDTAAGLRALSHLTRHAATGAKQRQQMLSWMLAAQRAQPQSELADNLLLRSAELLAAGGQDAERKRAIALLTRLATEHPTSAAGLVGQELRARMHRELNQPAAEAWVLERIVGTIETSHVVASYIEPAHTRSLVRLVDLYLGPLNKPANAEARLQRLLATAHAPRQIFAWLARMATLQEKAGKGQAALATWQRLLAEVARRQADMVRNDHRICAEEPAEDKRRRCLQQVATHTALPVKEAAWARAAIHRLQAGSRGPPAGRTAP